MCICDVCSVWMLVSSVTRHQLMIPPQLWSEAGRHCCWQPVVYKRRLWLGGNIFVFCFVLALLLIDRQLLRWTIVAIICGNDSFFLIIHHGTDDQWQCMFFCNRSLGLYQDVSVMPNLGKSRSQEIGCKLVLKFDRHLGSIANKIPVKFQSDQIIIKLNFRASRLLQILL